jgi:pyruvate dehydrogenase E1 component
MFGFQRIGDLIWAAGDMRCRGFLIGGTAGRTTLAGEGLQHQDGHSHLLAYPHPTVVAYDPAFAYEIAVIIEAGIRRMYVDGQDAIFYLTLANEFYPMPAMPPGAAEGILKGMYRLTPPAPAAGARPRVRLLGSGALVNEVTRAREILEGEYGVAAEVWSVTSYGELFRDALEADRWNRLHPASEPRVPYVRQCLGDGRDPVVAVSDYTRALPYSISRWIAGDLVALGTDGFGRSDTRAALRAHFEVDSRHVVVTALGALARGGQIPVEQVVEAMRRLEIDPEKIDPLYA